VNTLCICFKKNGLPDVLGTIEVSILHGHLRLLCWRCGWSVDCDGRWLHEVWRAVLSAAACRWLSLRCVGYLCYVRIWLKPFGSILDLFFFTLSLSHWA